MGYTEELAEKYLSAKEEVERLESELKASMGVIKGDLVRAHHNGKLYRVKFIMISKEGVPYLSLREIKNNSVNWESLSTPQPKKGEFHIVDWEFDTEKEHNLLNALRKTDSISEKEEVEGQLRDLYLSCNHWWEKRWMDDCYTCSHCGLEAVPTTEQDWLNGEKEVYNIEL